MLLIVSEQSTPRLSYILHFIGEAWNMDVKLVQSAPIKSNDVVIYYGPNEKNIAGVNIPCCKLLFENDIHPLKQEWNKENQCLEHFCIDGKPDYFSAIFFHLSRYEEYLPTPLDSLGRFDYKCSVAYKNKALNTPLVDVYLDKLLLQIQTVYPTFRIAKKKGTFTPTMDIDVAFDYKGRSFPRTIGAYLKDLKSLELGNIWQRTITLLRLKPDPAFIFDKLKNQNILFFIHVGKYGKLDKSCGLKNPQFKSFLKSLSPKNIGLHPSFQSHLLSDEVALEKQKLQELSEKNISASRQHFIKMLLPESYELLSAIGITDDYSMGWPQIPGYRAATVQNHNFYNLRTNEESTLRLHPFVWMDAHFLFNAHTDEESIEKEFYFYREQFVKYGGNFTPIFHNNHFKHQNFGAILYKLLASK